MQQETINQFLRVLHWINLVNQLQMLKKALAGVQLPIAGFRGSGLAWMVDILSGVLTGGNHAGRVKDPFDDFFRSTKYWTFIYYF